MAARARRGPGVRELTARLRTLEATLLAIRGGEVDAVVATNGGSVITLAGVDLAWRLLLDRMSEGAVTLTDNGIMAYGNARFAELARTPLARLVGKPLRRFVAPAERAAFDALLQRARRGSARGEGTFVIPGGVLVPVSVSFAPLRSNGSPDVIGVVGVIADVSARASAGAAHRLLVRQATATMEEERRRIAQELHDETGQSLTALLVGLRAIEESRTIDEAAERAHQLRRIAAQTLDEVGRLARGLHPRILEDLGLVAAVTRHAEEVAHVHSLAMDVRVSGLGEEVLPLAVQSALYRVLQEALTNVTKHAAAHAVNITLTRNDAAVELCIRDDGIGFDPASHPHAARHSLGLRVMRERAALLVGAVAIVSHPGRGTVITARYPLEPRLAPRARARPRPRRR